MKPGRELDARIATQVMGWRYEGSWLVSPEGQRWEINTPDAIDFVVPKYSTDIAATFSIVPNLPSFQLFYYGPHGDTIHGNDDRKPWHCILYPKNRKASGEFADTAPLAICLAALKAVE